MRRGKTGKGPPSMIQSEDKKLQRQCSPSTANSQLGGSHLLAVSGSISPVNSSSSSVKGLGPERKSGAGEEEHCGCCAQNHMPTLITNLPSWTKPFATTSLPGDKGPAICGKTARAGHLSWVSKSWYGKQKKSNQLAAAGKSAME